MSCIEKKRVKTAYTFFARENLFEYYANEDSPIRIHRMIDALVQSPEDVTKDAGFVHYDQLLLSEEVREWSSKDYIYPLLEYSRGESGEHTGGLLLLGARGTGKTALAKAIAVQAGVKFIPIDLRLYRNMRAIFTVARQQAPCVVFFDGLEKLLHATMQFNAQVDPEALRKQGIVIVATTN